MKMLWGVVLAAASLAIAQPREKSHEKKLHDEIVRGFFPIEPAFPEVVVSDSPNAAARYIWLGYNLDPRLAEVAGRVDLTKPALTIAENDAGIAADQLRGLLDQEEPWLGVLVETTQLTECDFHSSVDPRAFPANNDESRRNLWKNLRQMSRVLAASAVRHWEDGQRDKAIAELAAITGITRHLAADPDPRLMHPLVGAAILDKVFELTQVLLSDQRVQLTEAQRALLSREFDRLIADDPAGMRRSWNAARRENARFVDAQLADGQIGLELAVALGEIKGLTLAMERHGMTTFRLTSRDRDEVMAKLQAAVPNMSYGNAVRSADLGKRLGDELEEKWAAPDAEESFKDAELRAKADGTGVAEYVNSFAFRGCRRTWQKSVDDLAAIKNRLAPPR